MSETYLPSCDRCMGITERRAIAATTAIEPHRLHADKVPEVQDALDGAALRKLREALPEPETGEWSYTLTYDTLEFPDTNLVYWLTVQHEDDEYPRWSAAGATIAEAADKCREALE